MGFCPPGLCEKTPEVVRPFFFGASLVALKKKSGGVCPIAVGCTLRRLVAKVACSLVIEDMAQLLAPHQLGYGVHGGAEAAMHAACCFLNNMSTEQAVVKLDFANAINSLRRDCMLEAVCSIFPLIYSFVLYRCMLPRPLSDGVTILSHHLREYSRETHWAHYFSV